MAKTMIQARLQRLTLMSNPSGLVRTPSALGENEETSVAMISTQQNSLSYAQNPRGVLRLIVRIVALSVIALLGTGLAIAGLEFWQPYRLQRRCLTFSALPELVVYWQTTDAGLARARYAADTRYRASPIWSGQSPREGLIRHMVWDDYLTYLQRQGKVHDFGQSQHYATLFVGERRTEAGVRVLVVAEFVMQPNEIDVVVTTVNLDSRPTQKDIQIKSGKRQSHSLQQWLDALHGYDVQVFAGQPDTHDPSRLMIRFMVDGQSRVLTGTLQDDATVALTGS